MWVQLFALRKRWCNYRLCFIWKWYLYYFFNEIKFLLIVIVITSGNTARRLFLNYSLNIWDCFLMCIFFLCTYSFCELLVQVNAQIFFILSKEFYIFFMRKLIFLRYYSSLLLHLCYIYVHKMVLLCLNDLFCAQFKSD